MYKSILQSIRFKVVEIDNGQHYVYVFTLWDIINNEGQYKDTEMFYALTELHGAELIEVPENYSQVVRLNRDSKLSKGILVKLPKLDSELRDWLEMYQSGEYRLSANNKEWYTLTLNKLVQRYKLETLTSFTTTVVKLSEILMSQQ